MVLTGIGYSTQALTIQADGKIVTAEGYYLSRYNTDGSLDAGFGSNGHAYISGYMTAVALTGDDSILVGGYQYNSGTGQDFILSRYNGGDSVPPVTTVSLSGTEGASGWYTGPVTITLSATDANPGVAATYYRIGSSGLDSIYESTNKPVIATGGTKDIYFYSIDGNGNREIDQKVTIRIDKTAPTITASRDLGYEANADGWNNGPVSVGYIASDALSGLPAGMETGGFTFLTEGEGQSKTFTVTDQAGNSASVTVSNINIDWTPPILSASATTADNKPYTPGTWTNQVVTVQYNASDNLSGILSSPTDQVFGEGHNQTANGTVSDRAGNSASISLTGINVDQTKPTVTILSHPNGLTNDTSAAFTFSGNDALSGVDHLEYNLDGGDYIHRR